MTEIATVPTWPPFLDMVDRLVLHFTSKAYESEVHAAKKEFFLEAGVLDEADQGVELRMTQFLEWYIFSRPLSQFGLSPARYALQAEEFAMVASDLPAFESLSQPVHGLFEFLRSRGGDIDLFDLFRDKEIRVENSEVRVGFNRGEIFEARLVDHEDRLSFLRSFCFHPAEATGYIKQEAAAVRGYGRSPDRERLTLRLLKMRYKFEHYRHLRLDYIYTNEKKVRY